MEMANEGELHMHIVNQYCCSSGLHHKMYVYTNKCDVLLLDEGHTSDSEQAIEVMCMPYDC